jgi:hypothetical protein
MFQQFGGDTLTLTSFLEMTRALVKRGLIGFNIDEGGDFFTMHSVLLRLDKSEQVRNHIFQHCLDMVRRQLPKASPKQIPDASLWPQYESSVPHVISLCNAYRRSYPSITGSFEFAEMLYDAGFYMWGRWQMWTEGLHLLRTAESILDQREYDAQGKLRADIHSIIGILLDAFGISTRAENLRRRYDALAIRRHILKHEDQSGSQVGSKSFSEHLMYNASNDLALALLDGNDFRAAEKQVEICYAKYQQWGTEEEIPFEYMKYHHNIGIIRMYQGHYKEALWHMNRSCTLWENFDGRSAVYWSSKFSYANILLQAGQLTAALQVHIETLEGREHTCGNYDPWTLESCYAVGAMYDHTGDLKQARYRDTQAAAIRSLTHL